MARHGFSCGIMAVALVLSLVYSSLVVPSSAELQKLEHSIKDDGSLSLLVVGDWGRKGAYNQTHVAAQMGKIGKELNIDFVVSTGDNFYENGLTGITDEAFEDSFTNIYTAESLQKQWYSVLGNHDYRGDVLAQLSPVLQGVDSRWLCLRSFDLDSALEASRAAWKVVVGHHTIRSVSIHGDTKELHASLLPVLKAHGVDLYVNGHDHCLEHISSDDSPIQYLTSGGGSKSWRGVFNPSSDKLRFFYDGQGFMSLQLTKTAADVVFYDAFGSVLHRWRVTKELHSSI
ncbi:Purple acid phosphatase [Musa troglodytarum]|uniref:acid phosphatase n=1 Tax=Musa troglodytarum TaxID=320322 RepID=A0A9E7KHF6_9LILI|nr:Purple acid phosphatase [Musa troglodytarum]